MGTPAKQIGIYKITSPSGKVYIGQSWDILNRFRKYKGLSSIKKQVKLYNSLAKYGYDAHTLEIIKLHNDTVSQETLDNDEIFFIKLYKEQGFPLLNIREGGLGGKLAQESIEKMLTTRGKWNHTEETKLKISTSHFGIKQSEESKRKISLSKKGGTSSVDTRIKLREYQLNNDKAKIHLSTVSENNKKIIINTETGIFYFGTKEASFAHNIKEGTLAKKLVGKELKNNTNLIYI
jgi:group I intron endonuclease